MPTPYGLSILNQEGIEPTNAFSVGFGCCTDLRVPSSWLSQNDTVISFEDFQFSHEATTSEGSLIDGGFPDASLSAFYYLNNVPSPGHQTFMASSTTAYDPDGRHIDINVWRMSTYRILG